MPASVAKLDARLTGDQEVAGPKTPLRPPAPPPPPPPPPRHSPSFLEIDHEIFSSVILSFPLMQEGRLSVSGERMYKMLCNCLED